MFCRDLRSAAAFSAGPFNLRGISLDNPKLKPTKRVFSVLQIWVFFSKLGQARGCASDPGSTSTEAVKRMFFVFLSFCLFVFLSFCLFVSVFVFVGANKNWDETGVVPLTRVAHQQRRCKESAFVPLYQAHTTNTIPCAGCSSSPIPPQPCLLQKLAHTLPPLCTLQISSSPKPSFCPVQLLAHTSLPSVVACPKPIYNTLLSAV